MKKQYEQACLIGVGLIGASLARDLKNKKVVKTIIGFDSDKKNLNLAVKKRVVKRGSHLKKALATSDLVILAAPVKTIAEQIELFADFIPKKCLVIDVGSTKVDIVKQADRFFDGNFVGCHPMAGSEKSGAGASLLGLFEDAPCIIVPGKKTKKAMVTSAKQLWQAVGARTVTMDWLEHDRYLAACSHLPHILSFSLMSAVGKRISPKEIKKIAGKSFKSYTRIAGSDAKMWADIFRDNQKNVLNKIYYFKKELEKLEQLVKKGDEKKLMNYIKESSLLWREV